MGKLRLETPIGLSGYACYVKMIDTMLLFTMKNMENALNALEMSQMIFIWSHHKNWGKTGKRAFKKPLWAM